ncbi:hypothetical protein [Tautonia plasticadhaerens]|uniref:Uncharacterized protein n=1 Tax=Tautonia plasticadhaerens TaxID=2527974 RepID=A0A518HEJ0_9BACT|nr:hypothetical protein [Tautonia plasticadhaerens]QDV39269.1 hypothetical protein ElP_72330 [Tautonia plasticadhaerens]
MATRRAREVDLLKTSERVASAGMTPTIVMSRRFDKAYRRSNAILKGLIEGACRDFVRLFQSDHTQFKRRYDRLAQLPDVLEVDVTGGHRMIAHGDSEVLRLLDVGGHDVVPRYTGSMFYLDRLQGLGAPLQFYPEHSEHELRFFTRNPSLSFEQFGPELAREWVYFLSDQQAQVVEEIIEGICEAYTSGHPLSPSFILGGPGTGKTNILVNLLKDLTDLGLRVEIELSEECMALRFSGWGLDRSHAAAWTPPTRSRRTWLGVR